jgi:hypothetical protein
VQCGMLRCGAPFGTRNTAQCSVLFFLSDLEGGDSTSAMDHLQPLCAECTHMEAFDLDCEPLSSASRALCSVVWVCAWGLFVVRLILSHRAAGASPPRRPACLALDYEPRPKTEGGHRN